MKTVIPVEIIERKIYFIRGEKVMLSVDIAELYGVEPKVLIQAIKRNKERFPEDFMFQLTNQEFANLKSQIVTSSWGGIRRATPYAFTEQGVAMLSSVLRSKQAVQVNIAIIRTFVKLREILSMNKELANKLSQLERKVENHDGEIKLIFDAILRLMTPPPSKEKKIGFRVRERSTRYRTSMR
ncbi:MAG: ORF6N domain-containing protein [Nitrospirae bacterium]|nr:ORF6N domain-containing protein [Nitrospirota bacterium]